MTALREISLGVLVIHLQVSDLIFIHHLLLVLDLRLRMAGTSAGAMHLLLLLHLLVSLCNHLVDKLSGLCLVLGIIRILPGDAHRGYVLPLAGRRGVLRHIVLLLLLLLHHLLLLLLRLIHHIWFYEPTNWVVRREVRLSSIINVYRFEVNN